MVNYARGLNFAYGEKLSVVKWLMEPTVLKRFTHRFTHIHSEIFDTVFTHNAAPQSMRERTQAPLVPPHVPERDAEELISKKDKLVSAIGSREMTLPLHRARTRLLDELEANPSLGVEVFGKGRKYIYEKSDGLARFRYSVAIENSSTPNYWTEKISDCFLSMTVPIYVGATNIAEFFPKESFIQVQEDNIQEGVLKAIQKASIADYASRLKVLHQARALVLDKHDFGVQLALLLQETLDSGLRRKRVTRLWSQDTLVSAAVRVASRLIRPLRSTKSF